MAMRIIGSYRVTSASDTDIIETLLTFPEACDTIEIVVLTNSGIPHVVVANVALGTAPTACPDPSLSMAEGAAASNRIAADMIVGLSRDSLSSAIRQIGDASNNVKLFDQVKIRAFLATAASGVLLVIGSRSAQAPA